MGTYFYSKTKKLADIVLVGRLKVEHLIEPRYNSVLIFVACSIEALDANRFYAGVGCTRIYLAMQPTPSVH